MIEVVIPQKTKRVGEKRAVLINKKKKKKKKTVKTFLEKGFVVEKPILYQFDYDGWTG